MTDDRADGYDAIEWIARQPWSNGKIGMVGCSYVGATQQLAAMGRPPHLTTIIPHDRFHQPWHWGNDLRRRLFGCGSGIGYSTVRGPAAGRRAIRPWPCQAQHSKDRRHYLMNLPLRAG